MVHRHPGTARGATLRPGHRGEAAAAAEGVERARLEPPRRPDTLPLIDLDNVPATNITEGPDKDIYWGANAADMAYILYQVPVMVAVHADEMLE